MSEEEIIQSVTKKLSYKFISLLLIFISFISHSAYAVDRIRNSDKSKVLKTSSLSPRIVNDTVIVRFKQIVTPQVIERINKRLPSGVTSLDQIGKKFKIKRIKRQFKKIKSGKIPSQKDRMSRMYKVTFPANFKPEEVVQELLKDPNVESAETITIHPVYYTIPNDTLYSSQWALSQNEDHDVDAPKAWDINQGSGAVLLAVVDSGVDWSHPDLGGNGPDYIDGNVWINWPEYYGTTGVDDDGNGYIDDIRGWDWVDGVTKAWAGEDDATEDNDPSDFNGHGTHCSGIASAITDNGTGVAGLGWSTKIMALRAGWSGEFRDGPNLYEVGYVRMDFCAQAIVYATDMGATAINCSWGSSNSGGIAAAVDYAIANGVLMVVAAGNSGSTTADYLGSRGDCIDVAATESQDKKASYSNYGTWVDISAPGSTILSTYFNHNASGADVHTYASLSGTSMATPYVVGLIGLIKSYNPALTADQIRTTIYDSADNIEPLNPGLEGLLGNGRINAFNALNSFLNFADGTGIPSADPGNVPMGVESNLALTLNAETHVPLTQWELTIPSDWSWSQSASNIVNLTQGLNGASVDVSGNIITLSGIDIDKDGTYPQGSFTINNLSPPAASGFSTFASRTADGDGPLKPIEPIDDVKVLASPIVALPWSDNMESGGSSANGEWSNQTNSPTQWELGAPVKANVGPASARSGTQVWGTDLNLDYANFTDASLVTPYIDLRNRTSPAELVYYQYLDMEGTSSLWDGGIIEISTNNSKSWTQLSGSFLNPSYDGTLSIAYENPLGGKDAYTFDTGAWTQVSGNLDTFLGKLIKIRFRFGSDNFSDVSDGWFIDDISFTATDSLPPPSPSAVVDIIMMIE